jgi:DNA-binding NarL/FixJ family response regulator
VTKHGIRLLIVDDHALLREGLKVALAAERDIEVAAEAGNVADALALLARERFDVALLDVGLPDASGLALLQRIKSDQPELKVLMLSSYPEQEYGPQALRDGADGFLNKSLAPKLVAQAIRAVAAGGQYLSPALFKHLGGELQGSRANRKSGAQALSAREREVLRLLVSGKSATEIGAALHLSVKTVSTYRARILQKTGVTSNAELVRYALHRGIIS